jgi:tetratricopeptide (TPR) repeat protein
MMDNDKWVWADDEASSPLSVPLPDDKPAPIIDWNDSKPELPSPVESAAQSAANPEETPAVPETAAPVQIPSIPSVKAAPTAPVNIPPVPLVKAARAPAPAAQAPQPNANRKIQPSVLRAIVLHLESRIEEAIQEIQIGLRDGEPPVDLYPAMGALQLELERYDEAAASYREVLKHDPENEVHKQHLAVCIEKSNEAKKAPKPSPGVIKAVALHAEGKLEEAIKELQRGMKGVAQPPLDMYATLGHLQFELGRFDAAAEAYREVLKREPLHNTCHYNLAVCLEKTGRHKDALGSFLKAREIDPQRVEIGIGTGVSLLYLKRFPEALAAFEACLTTHPEDGAALFGRAFALHSAARHAEAEAAYLEALKRAPEQRETLVNLIGLSAAQGKDAATREYCGKLLALEPDSKVALEALVTLDLAQGNFATAYAQAERLTRLAPDSFEAWFNFGVACQGGKRLEHGVAAFAKAARIRPKSFEALQSLGQAMQGRGDFAGAKSAYESALKISPNHPAVLWNLVVVAEKNGNTSEAERLCELLASKAPKSEAALFRLGALRYERGDYSGSVEAFRGCLKARPDWPAAQLNFGLALWKAGNRNEARQMLESLEAAPYAADARHFLATVAAEREDYQGALGYYKGLAEGGERSAELFYNTGLILQNLGSPEEAAKQYHEAIAVKPDLAEAIQALAQMSKAPDALDEPRKNGRPKLAPQLLKAR